MAFEGIGEGLEGVVVDVDDGHGGGKAVSAALASQDCDFEASVQYFFEDGWAEVACGLTLRVFFWWSVEYEDG